MASPGDTIGELFLTYSRINKIQKIIDEKDYKTELDLEILNKEIANIELERNQIDINIKKRKKKEKKQLKKIFNSHINRPKNKNICTKDCCRQTQFYHKELQGGFNEKKINTAKLGYTGFAFAWAEQLNPPYARIYI